VVERHVANVNVVSSNLIARFFRGVNRVFKRRTQVFRAETGSKIKNTFCEVPAKKLALALVTGVSGARKWAILSKTKA
jgi:hypothetical protein